MAVTAAGSVPATGVQSIEQDWTALAIFGGDGIARLDERCDRLPVETLLGALAPREHAPVSRRDL